MNLEESIFFRKRPTHRDISNFNAAPCGRCSVRLNLLISIHVMQA